MPYYLINWLMPALCFLSTPQMNTHTGITGQALVAHATAATTMAFEGLLFESEEGRFSVRIPEGFSEPEASTMPLETAVGKLDMKVFTSMKGTGAVFMAAYIDYPEEAFAQGTDVMLDGAREGAMTNLNGKVESQKNMTLMGHPGRSLTFAGKSAGTKIYGRVDYYIVKPRLYQILFLTQKKSNVGEKAIKNAFTSFTLLNTPGSSAPRN